MIIKEVKEKLETSSHPVAKVLQQGNTFKVLVIGFKKGMILKEHKTDIPAKLIVLEGSVQYKEENRNIKLQQYDEVVIPEHVLHAVEAWEDSLCLLIKGE